VALRGTLKDFGIAEIFQLIGGQGKSGYLLLESQKGKLRLGFDKGSIVDVDTGLSRNQRGSLADLLVRAEIVTPAQMREALALQKKTLRRLADIVREQRWADPETLNDMVALEINEALYGLFTWKDGTYRFEPGEVKHDPNAMAPRSLEHFLMEGFRRIDEWPVIERRVGSLDTAYEVVAPLPAEASDEIGPQERRVFSLIRPDRTVSKLIDLSRIGEFETCRALHHLLDLGYVRATAPIRERTRRRDRRAEGAGRAFSLPVLLQFLAKGVVSLTAITLLFALLWYANPNLSALLRAPPDGTLGESDPRTLLGNAQLARLRQAIELYRLEKGRYPKELDDLIAAGLLGTDEVRYPWERRYNYRPGEPFALFRPAR
jgi:hypothetical protein